MVSLIITLFWTLCISSVSAEDHVNITAEPGQNVTLPCRSAGSSAVVVVVQWRRTDLGSEYVLLYRDGQFDPENQSPSYQNRVVLMDRQVKDRDVSLVLRNVTTNDTGLYQCRVQNEGSLNIELIGTVNLQVRPGDKDGGTNNGSIGLIVGLIIFAVVVVVAVISFLIYKKQSACLSKKTSDPPVDL